MPVPEHEIICLIVYENDQVDPPLLSVAAPDHMYFIVKPDALPPAWLKVAAGIVEATGNEVYGALARVTDPQYSTPDVTNIKGTG